MKQSDKHEQTEAWKPIPGWEGFYEASSMGRIRSVRRLVQLNSKQPERKRWMGGVVRKPNLRRGYEVVTLTGSGRRECMFVHRAVLAAFDREPQKGEITRHLNGNPRDNRIENLRWGSHEENMQDRKIHGNYQEGEDHCMAKLTTADVAYIRRSSKTGKAISKEMGIGTTQVSRIRRRESWTHVD